MATKIEWVQAVAKKIGGVPETWNPVRARNKATGGIGHFCVHKSAGCAHCYAERWQPRFRNPIRFAEQDRDKVEIFLDHRTLAKPRGWRKPRAVFAGDMTDLFGDWVPDWMLEKIFEAMAHAPASVFMLLTKRPERLRAFVRAHGDVILPNVWLGTSVEDQATADERIPLLLGTPAAVRFVSAEPLLGPVDLDAAIAPWTLATAARLVAAGRGDERRRYLHWVIVGGESGSKARPMHPDWARSLRDQCRAAGVPFFFKQWGEWLTSAGLSGADLVGKKIAPAWLREDGTVREGPLPFSSDVPKGATAKHRWIKCARVGKRRAGRRLDGAIHDQVPPCE